MKTVNKIFCVIVMSWIPIFAFADTFADKFFSTDDPNQFLTDSETEIIATAREWQSGKSISAKPVLGENGSIQFSFGAGQPKIICAVFQACDLALQKGERITSVHIGDSVRWVIDPGTTGTGPKTVQHIIIKPLEIGLETNLIVTTDRRTYHLTLRSHRNEFMSKVSFSYPEEVAEKWELFRAQEEKKRADRTIPQTGEYLGDLNFEYAISGRAKWKPVRVFNDGRKTIIQMPSVMAQTEAPILLVLRKNRGLFSKDDTVIVNYRLQGDRYIVDSVFDDAVLIVGVGRNQDSIKIKRRTA